MSALALALCFAAWLTFAVTGIPIGANPPLSAAIDALKARAIGAMILAKMTRATRGHTGRDPFCGSPRQSDPSGHARGGVCRGLGRAASIASPCFWIAAFARFALGYGPMMAIPRGVR